MGLTGDIAGLPQDVKIRLHTHIEFAKKWRKWMVDSFAHLLTPVQTKMDRSGWIAIQLQCHNDKYSLLFVYRLQDALRKKYIPLQGLDANCNYKVHNVDDIDKVDKSYSGESLMTIGLPVFIETTKGAVVDIISKNKCATASI